MKHFCKFNPFDANTLQAPMLGMQTVSADCLHCGRQTVFPVPREFVDWQQVAERYRTAWEKTLQRFDRIMKDVDIMHQENPAAEYLANEWKLILQDVDQMLGDT